MLENIVYNELIYNDYKVNVGTFDTFENDSLGKTKRKSLEIDFLAIKGNSSIIHHDILIGLTTLKKILKK